jgi:hypothetical protein
MISWTLVLLLRFSLRALDGLSLLVEALYISSAVIVDRLSIPEEDGLTKRPLGMGCLEVLVGKIDRSPEETADLAELEEGPEKKRLVG